MRPLEITLALLIALRILKRNRWTTLALAGAGLLHLFVEGYRWQMLPLYTFAAIMVLLSFRWRTSTGQSSPRSRRSWGTRFTGLILLIAASTLAILFPIPKIQSPSGPFPVGTVTLYLTDTTRTDPYAPDPNSQRELPIQIWYPAEFAPGAKPAPWMTHMDILGPAISVWIDMPSFFLDHLVYAKTHAYPDLSISNARGKYPLLIFSHGFGGFRAQNTFQMEELASHGYVVVAVEHTYASVVTVFPDGRVALHNPDTLPEGVSQHEYELAAHRLLQQWTQDLAFVLDQLAAINSNNLGDAPPIVGLGGRLDLDQVGVFGHSTGGGAAVEFCARDVRCKAGLAMDPWLVPVSQEVIENGPDQPFLFMFSEVWSRPNNTRLFWELYSGMNSPTYEFRITGTSHYDFTDLPALTPLAPYIGLKGPLNGSRVQHIVNTYSLVFFNQFLQGEYAPLLSGPSPEFPEVIFEGE